MIDIETRDALEKGMKCILCGGNMRYVSENKKSEVTMMCPACEKKDGITNKIVVKVKAGK